MDIFLVRHGEAAARWSEQADPGLSERGREQAEQVAKSLAVAYPQGLQLLSSPLRRAQETAAPLAEHWGVSIEIAPAFREVPSNVDLAERQNWLRALMRGYWRDQPAEVQAWRAALMARLLVLDRPCVIFTHFMVINAVLSQLAAKPETLYCWPDNGSVTHLVREDERLCLRTMGAQMRTVVN